ncbi:MAG TPA: T9SS type A sorting domain-containing protein [Bacteroidia bacterium]
MKRILLSASALCFALQLTANSGGPDAFGYIWKDSNEPGGPSYSWFDISQIGNPVTGLGDDNTIGPKPIGGNFQYYWYTVDKVWIGSNGYIGFDGPGNLASPFNPIPQAGGVDDYITGLMADLTFLGPNNQGRCYYYFNADTFCVSFENVPFWAQGSPGYTGANSFQIILNRADSSITINFKTQIGFDLSNATRVGMENNTGQVGLQVYSGNYPPINYTVKYYYPQNPSLQVTDAGAEWNLSDGTPGIFLKKNGNPYNLVSDVKNQGNTTIQPFQVNGDVFNLNNVLQAGNTVTTDSLVPGQDTVINFPNAFNPTQVGTYRFRTLISGVTGDVLSTNDTNQQEVVVIDTAQSVMLLNYNNNFTNFIGSSVGWNGGSGGVGMYFVPPVYPARVIDSRMMMTSVTTSQYSCYLKIYDDNGPGGSPGTLLDSVAVLSSQVVTSGVTTVPVGSNVVIASGGVYLLWDMAGTGAQIGVDITPPFSYQTFEVFQTFWSDYRDRGTQDFMLGLDIKKAFPEDVGVTRFVAPLNNATLNSPTQVKVYIKNFGSQPDNNFINVNYKLGLSGNTTTELYTGSPIPPGDSVLFTFATLLTPPYTNLDQLCAWTSKSTDINTMNDSVCINVNLVGMPEYVEAHAVKVYPNPTTGKLNFTFEENVNDALVIELYDVLGNKLRTVRMEDALSGKTNTIDISSLPAGIYTYTIRSDKKLTTGKVFKME